MRVLLIALLAAISYAQTETCKCKRKWSLPILGDKCIDQIGCSFSEDCQGEAHYGLCEVDPESCSWTGQVFPCTEHTPISDDNLAFPLREGDFDLNFFHPPFGCSCVQSNDLILNKFRFDQYSFCGYQSGDPWPYCIVEEDLDCPSKLQSSIPNVFYIPCERHHVQMTEVCKDCESCAIQDERGAYQVIVRTYEHATDESCASSCMNLPHCTFSSFSIEKQMCSLFSHCTKRIAQRVPSLRQKIETITSYSQEGITDSTPIDFRHQAESKLEESEAFEPLSAPSAKPTANDSKKEGLEKFIYLIIIISAIMMCCMGGVIIACIQSQRNRVPVGVQPLLDDAQQAGVQAHVPVHNFQDSAIVYSSGTTQNLKIVVVEDPDQDVGVPEQRGASVSVSVSPARSADLNEHRVSFEDREREHVGAYKFDWQPATLKAGDEIFLKNLYADLDLNDQEGVILEELDNDSFLVQLHKTNEELKVRSQNIAHAKDKDEEAREDFRASILLGGIGTAEEQEELRKAGLLSGEDIMELLQEPKLKKISASKVNDTWERCRGRDAAGPKHKNISYAIKKSDANNDGKLTVDELKRLTGAFVQHSGDSEMSSEQLFEILDENSDGELTFDEVLITFKAMYLLKSDGVKLDELLHD